MSEKSNPEKVDGKTVLTTAPSTSTVLDESPHPTWEESEAAIAEETAAYREKKAAEAAEAQPLTTTHSTKS